MRITMKTALAALALAGFATAGTEQHRKFTEDALKNAIAYTKNGNSAEATRGGQKQQFKVDRSRNGSRMKVTLGHSGGPNNGRAASLEYDESKQTVTIGAAGKDLAVVIRPDNTVMAGSTQCQGRDTVCIANAVMMSIPQMLADEVAAMLLVLNDDLHTTQHGDHISSALLQLAGELNKKANPNPAGAPK